MKLISAHVDRFGAIADKTVSFDGALTGIVGDNGAGKSTLSAFLAAVFYGLPTVNKRGVDFNDREHFRPFGGGSFGGSLICKTDAGDLFRIERLFDEKSVTEDKLTVYKNDLPFDCAGREIGEILFGVDKDAFSRTVFLSADTLDPEPGKSISDRLCEAVSNPEGTVPAKEAIKALDDAAKKIVPARGAKSNGELFFAKKAAADIEDDLRAAQAQAKVLPDLQESAVKLNREIAALRSRTLWRSYDGIVARQKAAESDLASATARFTGGVPDETALAETERKIAESESKARDAKTAFTPSARQTELFSRFSSGRPDTAALAAMESKAQEIRDAAQTAILPEQTQNPSPVKPKNASWVFPVAAVGGLAFLAGLILLIFSQTVPGAILLALGVIGLGAAALGWFRGKVSALEKSISAVDPGGLERARRAQLDANLSALLAPYGYTSPDGPLAAYLALRRDLADLEDAEKQKKTADADRAAASERVAALDTELSAFFLKNAIPVDAGYRAAMNGLRAEILHLTALQTEAEKATWDAAKFAAEQGLSERPTDGAGDGDPAQITALESEKNALVVKIAVAEREANRIPELEDALAKAEDLVEELKLRYSRLIAARDLLREAQENLVRRYVDPVKTSFSAYADALSSFLGKSVSLDPQFNLSYEEGGALRDHRHLSAGERSVAALCLRMALADNLYAGKELPPLVLDDPLVHLDEKNLARALPLLREVSKRRQIVCFTCHPSRAV